MEIFIKEIEKKEYHAKNMKHEINLIQRKRGQHHKLFLYSY